MPLYEYKCRKCGKHTEKIEKVEGPYLKKCPHCGGAVERLVSAPAIQFKGSGWYVTDYGKSSSGGANSEKGDGAGSDSAEKSEKSESKSSEKSEKGAPAPKEKKTAAKKK